MVRTTKSFPTKAGLQSPSKKIRKPFHLLRATALTGAAFFMGGCHGPSHFAYRGIKKMFEPVKITSAEQFIPVDKIWVAPAWAGATLFITVVGPFEIRKPSDVLEYFGGVGYGLGATVFSAITWAPVEIFELFSGRTPYFYDSDVYEKAREKSKNE